ncbi:MAG: NADH-quinone oxidoreductase subunit N [Armatimonadota bacterium]|nr:NADH-quinone oxidoreductase subunit N [Armatimonadota bacterium]
MNLDLRPLFPELTVVAAALAVLVGDVFVRGPRARMAWLVVGVLALSAAAAPLWRSGEAAFGTLYARDALGNALQAVALAVAGVGLLLARDYLVRTGLDRGEYYALVLLSTVGAMLMVASQDLLFLFVALETLSLPLYVLAGFARDSHRSQEASLKYFLLGSFASALLLYGVALVYGVTGGTALSRLAEADASFPLLVGLGLLVVGLGFKAAVVPFHAWAPDVYEGAPVPAVAFMSVVAKVGAVGALLRILPATVPHLLSAWQPLLAALSAATMVVGNLAALRQTNLKRMLAYSSVAHAGYLLIGVAAGSDAGVWSAVYYLAVYGAMNLGAFGVLTFLERAGVEADEVEDLRGLADRSPAAAAAFAVFMASLTGLPPTAGFVGKFYLFTAALEAGLLWLALVAVATSVVSVAYYLRAAYVAYLGPARAGVRVMRAPWAGVALGLSAAATLLFGVLPGSLTSWAQRVAALLR